MENCPSRSRRLRKTRLAQIIPLILGCVAAPYAVAQLNPGPPPIRSYAGDPGQLNDPASWRTAEFLRDWGMRAVAVEYAYAMGFAGQGMNIRVVDSGYLLEHTEEHAAAPFGSAGTRYYPVEIAAGTTALTPAFYNQTYNNAHGTHVSGTVGASRDGRVLANGVNMHGVAFDAELYNSNTHKTDGVFYGVIPAASLGTDAANLDNTDISGLYQAIASTATANGKPVRVITSSWGSQPNTENYNTFDPPAGSPATFGINSAWKHLITPDGQADINGKTTHWLN